MRISDWSADVCSSDLSVGTVSNVLNRPDRVTEETRARAIEAMTELGYERGAATGEHAAHHRRSGFATWLFQPAATGWYPPKAPQRSEEHTSELQSLMRISYAVFCLQKKKKQTA